MLSAYNLQSSFAGYGFYGSGTPVLIGLGLALLCLICLLGGGRGIVSITRTLVPVMGVLYVLTSLIVLLRNISLLPTVLLGIFRSAFDLRAIFSGFTGSCLMYGVRRGLFSNEAGVGSSPIAAAAACVSHPVKQGLVQTLSVFIDTVLCSATAFMCLCSGVAPAEELSGMPYIHSAMERCFGGAGGVFVTIAMALFAFTTLLGNFFYMDSCLTYLLRRSPGKIGRTALRIGGCAVIFAGCIMPASLVWDLSDALMGLMCLINLPALLRLSGVAMDALEDYLHQRREGRDPTFIFQAQTKKRS
jgi:AGCS family alanine or glycine:cation symporter